MVNNIKSAILILYFLFLFSFFCFAQNWENRKDNFKAIPDIYRPNPLWFWNNSEIEPVELIKQMHDLKRAGYGGVSILPFGKDFKPEYLTEAYFQTYHVCMEEAERIGLKLWIYDEYGFPSGTAGDINGDGIGRFKLKHPTMTNKRLDKTELIPKIGETYKARVKKNQLMAVVAMDTTNLRRIDLIDHIVEDHLIWKVPKGNWKIMIFECVDAGNTIIDYLDPNAAELYINMTHEAYYKRFFKYFGNVVEGTFFDEPTMYYADGRTWTPDFNKKFEESYGYSPALLYPSLWYNIGPETVEARNYLYGFRAQLFSEGYIKKVNDWSVERGIMATGHLDNEEILNCVGTSGDLMKSFKHLVIPGIDKIGGDRPAERFYKLISSSAYNWDHSMVMSETYGAMGNLSWHEIYGIAMEQYVKGINILIPHAAWYNTEKVTFLPELSLRNPIYADSLRIFNDYLSRLNILMKNKGRWVGDIAILYPINTMQGEHSFDGPLGYYKGGVEIPNLDYTDVSVNLFDSLGQDHIYLHPEVLNEKCVVENGKLLLQNKEQYNAFTVMVIPSCKTIDLNNLKKIWKFAKSGGLIIFTTQLPIQSTLHSEDKLIKRKMEQLTRLKNVYFVSNPSPQELSNVLNSHSSKLAINFITNPVRNIHKIVDGKHVWFFANPDYKIRHTKFELLGKFEFEVWNPHTGEIINDASKIRHIKNKTIVDISLSDYHSFFLVEK